MGGQGKNPHEDAIDRRRLFEAKRALNEFLKTCSPAAREYQKRVDRALKKAGENVNNRLTILSMMIYDNQLELKSALEELKRQLIHTGNALRDVRKLLHE